MRFAASSMSYGSKMPHPLHEAADGRMVYSVPLIIFMDDVSGNISKQWNKHHVIYASNANMPREMLEKEFYLRFVSSSPHASPMELMRGMKDCIWYASYVFRDQYSLIGWNTAKQCSPVCLRTTANTTKRSSSALMVSFGEAITRCRRKSVVMEA